MSTLGSVNSGSTEHASLASRITLIVFWGMVGLGLIGTVWLMHYLEQGAEQEKKAARNQVILVLQRHIIENRGALGNLNHLSELLRSEISKAGLDALVLSTKNGLVTVGSIEKDDVEVLQKIDTNDNGVEKILVKFYERPFSDTLSVHRRQVMASFGGLLLLFGFAFHALLRRLVTRPFEEMINQANIIIQGDVGQRFKESGIDEFGFLSKFMNRALDQLTQQQDQLRVALENAHASEMALSAEKERIEVTLHSIGNAVITTDAKGKIELINPAAAKLFDIDINSGFQVSIEEIVLLAQEKTRIKVPNPVLQCLHLKEQVEASGNIVLLLPNEQIVDVACMATPIFSREGEIFGAVIVFHDISQSTSMARALAHQASHDALTGLVNRAEFESLLATALTELTEDGRGHAVGYIDMDQFKIVNDTCGHAAGDELLRQFAQLLKSQVRDTDIVARLGGDEFALLLFDCDAEKALFIMNELLTHIREFRFGWEGQHFNVGASMGLVHIDHTLSTITNIMREADVACYAAKEGGRNRLHVYSPEDESLRRRHTDMNWVTRIDKAIQENRFCLYAQPVVSTHDTSRGWEYLEILVKFIDEAGNVVSPGAFVPAAERYSLMHRVDRWVFKEVCKIISDKLLDNTTRFGINISAQSLSDPDFLEYVVTQIDTLCIDPTRLCFEITETAAISKLVHATEFISLLHRKGCLFALDDFGSGLSSFSYLKKLRVDYLKIDGAFVKDIAVDTIDRAMVLAIHQIGVAMNIPTIAEYVENDSIHETLKVIGVDFVQGYSIAKPVPIETYYNKLLLKISAGAS